MQNVLFFSTVWHGATPLLQLEAYLVVVIVIFVILIGIPYRLNGLLSWGTV